MAFVDFAQTAEMTVAIADHRAMGLSALEWSVVALARRDSLTSLGKPGRVAMALAALFGSRPSPKLADPRLEALRRLAVHAWHRGFAVPQPEVERFLRAGFSSDQLELVITSISRDRSVGRRRAPA